MKKILILTTILPLLMSSSGSTNYNELKYHSSILNDDTYIYKLLKSGTIKEICPSNILNNEAASVQMTYEFFEKHKDYAPYNGYKTSYHLIYKLDIFLNANVHYKGGVGNWFDGYNPTYINSITVRTNAESEKFDNNTKVVISPEQLSEDDTEDNYFTITKEMHPTSGSYGSSYYNHIYQDSIGFSANDGYTSTSYNTNWNNGVVSEDFTTYNNRLVAYLRSSKTIGTNKITYTTTYKYGTPLVRNIDGEYILNIDKDESGTIRYNDLYSGPNKNGNDFKFTIFGAFNIQNDFSITNLDTEITLKTTHGSTVWLDKFTSTANINLSLI